MSSNVPFSENCDQLMRKTGFGLYHYFLIGLSSACGFAQAAALNTIPFATPFTMCEGLHSPNSLVIVNACFAFGWMVGGWLFPVISDIVGRKCMIPFTLMTTFGGTFSAAFSHGNSMLFVCIIIIACGISSNAICVKMHLCEMLPSKQRGFWLAFTDLFWSIGYTSSSVVNWLLSPTIVETQKVELRVAPWRIMFALSGVPCILVACASSLVYPNHRQLIFNRKYSQAYDVLKRTYAINNSRQADTYTAHREDLRECVDEFDLYEETTTTQFFDRLSLLLKKIQQSLKILLTKRFVLVFCLLVFIKFAAMLRISHINIWLAKMLTCDPTTNCVFEGKDISYLATNVKNCTLNVSTNMARLYFVLQLPVLCGQILLLVLIDTIGRRFALVIGCTLGGLTSILLNIFREYYLLQVTLAAIFILVYSFVSSCIGIIPIEMFPTAIRGTAVGSTYLFANFINFFFIILMSFSNQYLLITFACLMLMAAVLGVFIPELRDRAIVE